MWILTCFLRIEGFPVQRFQDRVNEILILNPVDPAKAIPALRGVVESLPRTRVVSVTDSYLHAEFRSRIFGFVDDVEFLVDAGAGAVHVRSASRTGYSDLGVNRKRVEEIRAAFANADG